jgi:uroporphyrinogen decarboxylase
MIPRERVLRALQRQQPDRVPYCELAIDRYLAHRLMNWEAAKNQTADLESNTYHVEEAKALARHLGLDNISCVLRAPVYAEKVSGMDGRLFYGQGRIKSREDLDKLQLPDPHSEDLFRDADEFCRQKDEFACFFVTRAGIFPTMLSMGMETFCVALYEDPDLLSHILDTYFRWSEEVAVRACRMGFDAYISTDDMAFKTAPYFSPQVFRQLVLPRYRRLAEKINIPWIIHSDGNILPFVQDLLDLGIAGLHPIEKGAMDIRQMKKSYGSRLCLLGNVDLNLLGKATPGEVDREVQELIRDLAPGGGYIVTSGNSLAGYLRPENVRALSRAVKKYGVYR